MSPIRLRQYIIASSQRKILQRLAGLESLREKKSVVSYEDLLTINRASYLPFQLVLQNTCLVRWFLSENGKMNEQKIKLKLCFKLERHPKKLMRCWYAFVKTKDCPANVTKKCWSKLNVLPYSPDLNLTDFFLLPRLKLDFKGNRFDDIPDIQRNVTRLLNSIPNEDFLKSFQYMYSRPQRCIVMRGDYLEEQ
ncbi:histone-lysine N-methyltransferase SETMAR [Trichonephila clavipes]|nr:histone-lysine N-methyltransferase SETMAR [Trichonephila clavipes]